MAGLSGGRRPGDSGRRRGDRGQLLLVFAFGIAVLFVVLALLLNGAIYAGTAATRSVDGDAATDAVEYRHAARGASARRLATVNAENDSSYASLRSALRSGIDRWSTLAGRHRLAHGRAANLSLVNATNGTRIAQSNRTRALTNASGAGDWTLVNGSEATRDFRANVSRASLVDATANDSNASALRNEEVFRVLVEDADDTWEVFVYQDGTSDVLVKVDAGAGNLSDACRAAEGPDGHVVVDLSNGTVGGAACRPLAFFGRVDPGHRIAYRDGTAAAGTYSLVVARHVTDVRDGDFATPGTGDDPVATPALYAATVRVDYRTPRLAYAATVTVEGGDRSG